MRVTIEEHLRRYGLFIAVVLVIIVVAIGQAGAIRSARHPVAAAAAATFGSGSKSIAIPVDPDIIAQVIARTNMYRAQFSCPALQQSARLTLAAQGHSDDMAQHDVPGHIGSNGSTPEERIKATGYVYRDFAENVAWGQSTPEAAVDAWFNETPPNDGHRRNILNCALTEIGVGYAYLTDDPPPLGAHYYWTQDFAIPA